MTSTVGQDPMLGEVTDGVSVASLSPPTRRRPSWIALGVLLIGVAGLLGAYVFSVVSDTVTVTVAARDIEPGAVLGPDDIRVVEMGRTGDLRAVQADQQDLIIGLAARGPIPAGTVLNTGLFVESGAVIPDGSVVVGAAFEAGAVPTRSLAAGDVVRLLRVADATGATGSGETSELGEATVWAVEGDASAQSVSERTWVSLVIDAGVQLDVSQAAADETLRLVLVGSS